MVSIANSRWFRDYCPECGCSMRVEAQFAGLSLKYCRQCDPYTAVGSPNSLLNDVEHDPDAYAMSMQNEYHGFVVD